MASDYSCFMTSKSVSLGHSFGFIHSISYWLFSPNFPWALYTQPDKKGTRQPLQAAQKYSLSWWHYHLSMTKIWIIPDPWVRCPILSPNLIRHQCISLFLINPLLSLSILGCVLSHPIYCKSPVSSTSLSLHCSPLFLSSLILDPLFTIVSTLLCYNGWTCLPKLMTPHTT